MTIISSIYVFSKASACHIKPKTKQFRDRGNGKPEKLVNGVGGPQYFISCTNIKACKPMSYRITTELVNFEGHSCTQALLGILCTLMDHQMIAHDYAIYPLLDLAEGFNHGVFCWG